MGLQQKSSLVDCLTAKFILPNILQSRTVFITIIVDLIENRVYVQLEKDAQTSLDRQFLFTCQLVPQQKESTIQNEGISGMEQPTIKEQTYLWDRMVPNYGSSRISNQSQEIQPEIGPESNWGNWPIDPITTLAIPVPEIKVFASSEEKFENWPFKLRTEESSGARAPAATAVTTYSISTESSKSEDISLKVLEETKHWRNEIFVPLTAMNTPTTSVVSKITALPAPVYTTIGWFHKTEPLQPVRIFATQVLDQKRITDPNMIYMEIQYADGVPFGSTVNRPIRIGENISLVVRTMSHNSRSDSYNIFVHSCNASDGPGLTRIMLIDRFGCAVRPTLTGQMNRMKKAGQIYYYFRISAFKFPGPDDVYFSCTVDIAENNSSPEICKMRQKGSRKRRNFYSVAKQTELHESILVLNGELIRKPELRKVIMPTVRSVGGTWKFSVSLVANIIQTLIIAYLAFLIYRLKKSKHC